MKGARAIKVWVTRDEGADGPLCAALRRAGLEPVYEPVIERRVTGDVEREIAALLPEDWLVLTSAFAVRAIPAERVRCRVAVVGEASRAEASVRGLSVALVSPDGTGAGLWKALAGTTAGARRVCYPRSSRAEGPARFEGVEVSSPVLYHTAARAVDPARVAGVSVAAVASPSAVAGVLAVLPHVKCASIGPTTSAALRACGMEPWVEAREASFEAMAMAIAEKSGSCADGGPG